MKKHSIERMNIRNAIAYTLQEQFPSVYKSKTPVRRLPDGLSPEELLTIADENPGTKFWSLDVPKSNTVHEAAIYYR